MKYEGQENELSTLVVEGSGPSLFGRDWLKEVKLDWKKLFKMNIDEKQVESRLEKLAVYKSGTGTRGRGHWDACVGTWDLGTRGHLVWDAGRMGRGDVWDAGTCGTGTRGCQM